jgi:hypothetical protein
LGDSPGLRQPPFGLGIALSIELRIPLAFRRDGVRLLDHPVPTEELGYLTVDLSALGLNLIGVAVLRTDEIRVRRMPPILRGGWVPANTYTKFVLSGLPVHRVSHLAMIKIHEASSDGLLSFILSPFP